MPPGHPLDCLGDAGQPLPEGHGSGQAAVQRHHARNRAEPCEFLLCFGGGAPFADVPDRRDDERPFRRIERGEVDLDWNGRTVTTPGR